mmetsp:Transcript_64449/g.153821  ORF Transcript_64449/g.153821 Transcript_64449/m.153821 type:complete len:204 (-) Transcript_64449:96-707(-)
MENHVFGCGADWQLTTDLYQHRFGLLLHERLGGQHMLDLGSADSEGNRTKGSMRGGVTVATHHGGSWKCKALLWPDNVDNALSLVVHAEVCEAEVLHILLEGLALVAGVRLLDEGSDIFESLSTACRHIVVNRCQRAIWSPHSALCVGQRFKRLGGSDFVHQVPVNVNQAGAILGPVNDVILEDLLVDGPRSALPTTGRRLRA